MRNRAVAFLAVVLALGLAVGVQAFVLDKHHVKADKLSGYQETPAISTAGTGTFSATTDDKAPTTSTALKKRALSPAATQAHIHFGNRFSAQGISAFLCTNLGNGPAGTPACPAGGGTVTG